MTVGRPKELWKGPPSTCGASWKSPAGRAHTPSPNRGHQQEVVMAARGVVAVVGARQWPWSFASHVQSVVGFFVGRGWGIGSGGARGADQFALEAVLATGRSGSALSGVFLPGRPRGARSRALGAFVARGGCVVPGA